MIPQYPVQRIRRALHGAHRDGHAAQQVELPYGGFNPIHFLMIMPSGVKGDHSVHLAPHHGPIAVVGVARGLQGFGRWFGRDKIIV